MDIYITLALMLMSGVCGFYLSHRGLTGVQTDLNNVKQDVENLKIFKQNATVSITPTVSLAPEAKASSLS